MRQTGMRSSWVTSSAAVVAMLSAGCASASAQTSTTTPSIRGAALSVYSCHAQEVGQAASVAPAQVLQFRLCALPYQGPSSHTVTIRRGDSDLGRLRRALSAPDAPKSTGACPMYADVVQQVLAKTASGYLLVHIPVDGCGHYQSAALAALNAARADG
jgi:hypothetical protein